MSLTPPVVSGYAGGYDPRYSGPGAGADYNSMVRYGRTDAERRISTILSKPGNRTLRAVWRALTGVAVGGAVNDVQYRIQAQTPFDIGSISGVRTVEPVTNITGVTTTAQRDYINNQIIDSVFNQAPQVYPNDLSGNGGGSKIGR